MVEDDHRTIRDVPPDYRPGWPRFSPQGAGRVAPPALPAHAVGQPEQRRVTGGEAASRARRALVVWRARNG
jgi:hypothetical protein